MQDLVHQQAPPQRIHVTRLTPELKALPVDSKVGVRLDPDTVKCLRIYAKYHGWQVVQKRDGDSVIIWRIG